jgi:sulfoquinovose isomerase
MGEHVVTVSANSQTNWAKLPFHRDWLKSQANGLFDFFQYESINPKGGFFDLNTNGAPLTPDNQTRSIHMAARMVHCFSIAHLLGRPGAGDLIDHGMNFIWNQHRDSHHGGYFWQVNDNGPVDSSKQGYGHAFVLLAASSAKVVGHPLADKMLADISEVLDSRFWEEQHGAIAEEFNADWSPIENYRGQNSNMHLTEALMAAFEVTGDSVYLERAERIADLIIRRHAASLDYRVPEHFDSEWTLRNEYRGNEMFRPSGSTPGHWLEWSRLLLQLWVLGGKAHEWMPQAAHSLFVQSMAIGWDHDKGGFFYTLDWNNVPDKRSKLWWPVCEAIGAAHFLNQNLPEDAFYEDSYRLLTSTVSNHFLDHKNGGWHEELTEDLKPANSLFPGKGDIYHALQACLIPLFPAKGSLTKVVVEANA